jgi:hypothetical protein
MFAAVAKAVVVRARYSSAPTHAQYFAIKRRAKYCSSDWTVMEDSVDDAPLRGRFWPVLGLSIENRERI